MKSEREREREGKNLHSLVQSPRVNGQSGAGMKPRTENLPGPLCGCKGPMHSSHFQLSSHTFQGASGSELEQPGLEPVSRGMLASLATLIYLFLITSINI